MKICILSNKGSKNDEGQRNTASSIAKELMKENEVLHLNAKETFKNIHNWKKIKQFNPDIIHFFLRPTISTFIAAKLFQLYLKNIPTVFSAVQPIFPSSKKFGVMLKLIKPSCVLALTQRTEEDFLKLEIKTAYMRCGVDIERFHPVSANEKTMLRRKYNLAIDKPIALHVGHLTPGRNLESLGQHLDSKSSFISLIVVSPLFEPDRDLLTMLKSKGAVIISEYLPNIEEIYQVADIYLFPTISSSYCIEAPLSVFEAMATNLPVITTRFGVLPYYFEEGDGLIFVSDPCEIPNVAAKILSNTVSVNTRGKVSKYTWQTAASEILKTYKDIISER